MSGFTHARVLETRWGQALAFLDLDDGMEVLRLHVWAPVCEDGSLGLVSLKVGLDGNASDAAVEAMEAANRSAIVEMTAERFEATIDKMGVGKALDALPSPPVEG